MKVDQFAWEINSIAVNWERGELQEDEVVDAVQSLAGYFSLKGDSKVRARNAAAGRHTPMNRAEFTDKIQKIATARRENRLNDMTTLGEVLMLVFIFNAPRSGRDPDDVDDAFELGQGGDVELG